MAVWYSDGAQKALTNGTYTVDAPQAEKELLQIIYDGMLNKPFIRQQSIFDGMTITKEPFVQKQKEKDMQFTIIKMSRGGYLVRDGVSGSNVAAFGEIDKLFAFLHNEFDPPLGRPTGENDPRAGQAKIEKRTISPFDAEAPVHGVVIGVDPAKKW